MAALIHGPFDCVWFSTSRDRKGAGITYALPGQEFPGVALGGFQPRQGQKTTEHHTTLETTGAVAARSECDNLNRIVYEGSTAQSERSLCDCKRKSSLRVVLGDSE